MLRKIFPPLHSQNEHCFSLEYAKEKTWNLFLGFASIPPVLAVPFVMENDLTDDWNLDYLISPSGQTRP